ncbi:MAG: adenylate/guanylate cyclase domain-containing protein, partial [Candidatus Wallbacteria bacterium]|nr:adenylate/guanylate cyclase domain-containing protein [Candidatus Wallbacteria bacterium]
PQNIELLEAHLVPQGYDTVSAENGAKALQKIASGRIDLVLLDVMMPGMNGYEVCRIIKHDHENSFLPVVMLTSLDNIEAKIEGLEAGADDFLNKPFQKVELLARVNNLLKIKFLHDEVELRNNLISSMLHRYVDNRVIKQILSDPGKYSKLGGDKKEVAVFFCDIRGFTALSETMSADELIRLLNSIYKELTGIVFRNRGTFDKYMGDSIMAFWGAPTAVEDETLWAVRAASEMHSAFKDLKQGWPGELQTLGIGIGINYGEVIVGNIGTEEKMDYTVIGDIVNTAKRIETAAEHGQTLITRSALDRIREKIKVNTLEPVHLRGKSQPVEVFEVVDTDPDASRSVPGVLDR